MRLGAGRAGPGSGELTLAQIQRQARATIKLAMPTLSPPSSPDQAQSKSAKRRSRRELARAGALVALAVLITLFAVLNVKQVRVDWIFGSGNAPLIVVIVLSLLVGIVLTHFAERIARKRR